MRLKKVAALATAVVLAVSVFAGCGGSGSSDAAPVITLPESAGDGSNAFANEIKSMSQAWVNDRANDPTELKNLAQSWLDQRIELAEQDGNRTEEEEEKIKVFETIVDRINSLDLTSFKVEENVLNDSLYQVLTDMVESGAMTFVYSGDDEAENDLLAGIIARMEGLNSWPAGQYSFYIDIVPASEGVKGTAEGIAERILKEEAARQVSGVISVTYQTGVVQIVQGENVYYVVLWVAL